MPASSSECADTHQGPRTSFSRAGTPALCSVALAFGGLDVLGGVGDACVLAAFLLFLATDRSIRPPGTGRSL